MTDHQAPAKAVTTARQRDFERGSSGESQRQPVDSKFERDGPPEAGAGRGMRSSGRAVHSTWASKKAKKEHCQQQARKEEEEPTSGKKAHREQQARDVTRIQLEEAQRRS